MFSSDKGSNKTILTALAGLGVGAVTAFLKGDGDSHRGRSKNDDSSVIGSLFSAVPGAAATLAGGRAMGLGGSVGAKLAAAYLAGKAAKETLSDKTSDLSHEAGRRGHNAYDALRGRTPPRRDTGGSVDTILLAVALVGLGAGAAYLLDPSKGAARRRQIRDATGDALGHAKDAAASAADKAAEFTHLRDPDAVTSDA